MAFSAVHWPIDTDASFVYNENGLRVQKTVNGVVTDYTLHGKNIVHMTCGSDNLHFFYDAQGKPAVVVFNGVPYSYVKNLQGDIVAILDSTGAVVVSYVYDAWGKPISKTGSLADTLGEINPFRYRSYTFDCETGLYYLRSRYYHPSICRFVNADILYEDNLFVYCKNNPVIHVDSEGLECVICFNENGMPVPFTVLALGIGGGGVSALGGYIQVKKVLSMDQEDCIREGIAIASFFTSMYIMKGASSLALAFFHEADDLLVGSYLYGTTISGGVIFSKAVDIGMKSAFGQSEAPFDDFDLIKEIAKAIWDDLKPWETPVAIDFLKTYLEETTVYSLPLPLRKRMRD